MDFKKIFFIFCIVFFNLLPGSARAESAYECGGAVEEASWRLWDQHARSLLRNQFLDRRLLQMGDSYALYDIQVYFQNLEAMAERCGRSSRLIEFADDLMVAYDALEALNNGSNDRVWVCKGGSTCKGNGRLIGKEVPLVSAQGLGLMSALAAALANSKDFGARSHPFVIKTASVSAQHLLRWGGIKARERWRNLIDAKPDDVKNANSELLFSDQELWQIAIYANLAKIYTARPALEFNSDRHRNEQPNESIQVLLHLFKSRVSFKIVPNSRLGRVRTAEIDRGFWRMYGDSRYAGYEGSIKPIICDRGVSNGKAELVVDGKDVPIVPDIGWDFSHARRLVHVLTALQGSQLAMQQIYGLRSSDFPDADLAQAFAAQLVVSIWNGDKDAPLFANYWSGANGWYRATYENGSKSCSSGYPPFGLTEAFATGGYAVWAKYYPAIDEIAHSIYILTIGKNNASSAYIENYFSGMTSKVSSGSRMINQLMFWPSMVH
ncbi:hypothetical protein [Variovorax sp. Varisp36]|uniref:hypothetical protein n=1 Tax=Variovorax sp. Varisp36 TaxID=3243031 RepID=UPI0039A58F31